MNQDKILRAYTRLKGIKEHTPNKEDIPASYITDYHAIIDSLEKETSFSLSEFRIPRNELIFNFFSENEYSRGVFMSKLDALLSYFEIKFLSTKEPEIGFKPPNKEKKQ